MTFEQWQETEDGIEWLEILTSGPVSEREAKGAMRAAWKAASPRVERVHGTPRTDALVEQFRGLSLRGMNIALCDLCRELEGGKIPGVLYSEVSDPTNYNPAPGTGSAESNEREPFAEWDAQRAASPNEEPKERAP